MMLNVCPEPTELPVQGCAFHVPVAPAVHVPAVTPSSVTVTTWPVPVGRLMSLTRITPETTLTTPRLAVMLPGGTE